MKSHWTEEQRRKAKPRLIRACRLAQATPDIEEFWLLAGVIAGGIQHFGPLMELTSERILYWSRHANEDEARREVTEAFPSIITWLEGKTDD